MNSYKLVQFLKTYVNLQGIEILIIICLYTIQKWLGKLGYKYKDVQKSVFIDGHEQCDIVKDYKEFIRKMKELKPYMIEFKEDSVMKNKIYLSNCGVRGENQQSVILITNDKCTFFANDNI